MNMLRMIACVWLMMAGLRLEALPPAEGIYEIFAVRVDNLRIRRDSSRQSAVLTRVSRGQFVSSTGVHTALLDTATLRGVYYEAPYHQVTTLTPDKVQGYAFGGGLLRVYAGPREQAPDLNRLGELMRYLNTLPPSELLSGGKAWQFVTQKFGDARGPLADAAYLILHDLLQQMEYTGSFYTLTESIAWEDDAYEKVYNNTFDMKTYPQTRTLGENGFSLATAEGTIFPVVDERRFQQFFAAKCTPAMASYLKLLLAQHEVPVMSDGGLVISPSELADRVLAYEAFNQTYPDFVQREEVQNWEKWNTFSLLAGADNTPVADYETYEIVPEFQQAWDAILRKAPRSRVARHIGEVKRMLDASGGKYTDEIQAYVNALVE